MTYSKNISSYFIQKQKIDCPHYESKDITSFDAFRKHFNRNHKTLVSKIKNSTKSISEGVEIHEEITQVMDEDPIADDEPRVFYIFRRKRKGPGEIEFKFVKNQK